MKRKRRIWIYVLLLLLAVIAAIVIWQRENLRTVRDVLTNDEQSAAAQLQARQEKDQDVLQRYDVSVTPPSIAQQEDLLRGKASAQEIKQQLGLDAQSPQPSDGPAEAEAEAPPEGEPEAEAAEAPDAQTLVEDCVRRLYAKQLDLMEELGSYRQSAILAWDDLSPEERTDARKMSIAYDGLEKCQALEKQADADVRAMLDECRAQLEAIGASADVVDELWESYLEQKHASRVYFLSQYL